MVPWHLFPKLWNLLINNSNIKQTAITTHMQKWGGNREKTPRSFLVLNGNMRKMSYPGQKEIVMHKISEWFVPLCNILGWLSLPALCCSDIPLHKRFSLPGKTRITRIIPSVGFSVDRVCPGDLESEWWRSVQCGSGMFSDAEIREQAEIIWQQLNSRKIFYKSITGLWQALPQDTEEVRV